MPMRMSTGLDYDRTAQAGAPVHCRRKPITFRHEHSRPVPVGGARPAAGCVRGGARRTRHRQDHHAHRIRRAPGARGRLVAERRARAHRLPVHRDRAARRARTAARNRHQRAARPHRQLARVRHRRTRPAGLRRHAAATAHRIRPGQRPRPPAGRASRRRHRPGLAGAARPRRAPTARLPHRTARTDDARHRIRRHARAGCAPSGCSTGIRSGSPPPTSPQSTCR